MDVNGLGSVHSAYPIPPSRPAGDAQPPSEGKPVSPQDEVEISSAGKLLDGLNGISEVRAERLSQIKEAIDAGTYETPEKLEAALQKLLDQLDQEG